MFVNGSIKNIDRKGEIDLYEEVICAVVHCGYELAGACG